MKLLLALLSLAVQAQIINSGGAAVIDSGNLFEADKYFSGGTAYQGTVPAGVPGYYSTQRYGNFVYTVSVAPGEYDVYLHFYELTSTVNGPGKRRFKININGVDVLPDYDIWAADSPTPRGPVVAKFRVTATNEIRIQATTIVRNAVLNAFQIQRVVSQPATALTQRVEVYRAPAAIAPKYPVSPRSILQVYRNGRLQTAGEDYQIIGGAVSFTVAAADGDIVILDYWSESEERVAKLENVRIVGTTHTQAVLAYTAPSTAACTFEVSKSPSFSPLAHDVNPALFAGAGSDGGGDPERVISIGQMTVDTAADGKNYSRALQTATKHHYRIGCTGETATGTFETRNIPLGMTYVPNQPVDGVTGQWKVPYSSPTDRGQEIIDPITGALLKKTMLPGDGFEDRGVPNQSKVALPTSGGFHDICGKKSADGWFQCVISGQLYGIEASSGLVRNLGDLQFLNASIPGLFPSGGNNCGTFGDGSRLWSSTEPNVIYCGAPLANGGQTLVRLMTDATNAEVKGGERFRYSSAEILLPEGLETLLARFDPTLPPGFNCGFDAVQMAYLLGSCRAGNQDTWAYTFAYLPGTGIVAVNKVFSKPICRWCTFHTLHSQGNTPVMGFEVQRPSDTLSHGNNPGRVTLNGAIDATQTTINVASSYPSTPQARPGTITTSGNDVNGTGTTFPSEVALYDTITAGGQSRIVYYIGNSGYIYINAPFSPELVNEPWTVTYRAAPEYTPGDPISHKFPRYLQAAAVGDYFELPSGEHFRITGKPSNTQWTVERGCSYFEGPCSGTGSPAPDGTAVTAFCNAFVTDGYALAYYWDFVADPMAIDSNIGDKANAGNHAFAGVAHPHGFSGAHQTSRGKIRAMAGYSVMAVPTGLANRKAWARQSNYSLFQNWLFCGRYSPNGGNTFQRHPSCHQADSLSGYEDDYFTDVTPFIGGNGFVNAATPSTQVEGTLYRVGLPDPNINPEPRPTRKYLPTLAVCGSRPLGDISGPNSHITNSPTDFTYCNVERDGECRNVSDVGGAAKAGEHFVNCPTITHAYCTGGETFAGYSDICVGNQAFDGNATVQFGVTVQPDEDTVVSEGPRRARVLAKVFDAPRGLPNTANAKVLPDGSWIMHPGVSSLGNEIWLLKNPGMPPLDNIDRQNFIPVKVQIPPFPGADNAYVEFGYDKKLHCTGRAESCVAAANNNPYFFAGEPFGGVPCESGCTIDVPSIPSRVLRYRIIRRKEANVVSTSLPYLIAVP